MDMLDRLLGHDAWTTKQLLLLSQDLTDDQLDREFDLGLRTLRATLGHVVRNVEIWSALMESPPVPRETIEAVSSLETGSVESLILRHDIAASRFERIAHDVAARDGWDETWLDTMDNPPSEKTYGGAIGHVITHSMHHRCQILYMLRRLGVEKVPEGDVLSWEHQAGEA